MNSGTRGRKGDISGLQWPSGRIKVPEGSLGLDKKLLLGPDVYWCVCTFPEPPWQKKLKENTTKALICFHVSSPTAHFVPCSCLPALPVAECGGGGGGTGEQMGAGRRSNWRCPSDWKGPGCGGALITRQLDWERRTPESAQRDISDPGEEEENDR